MSRVIFAISCYGLYLTTAPWWMYAVVGICFVLDLFSDYNIAKFLDTIREIKEEKIKNEIKTEIEESK